MNQQRKLSFDMIRIIAVAMVVMIHVSAYVVTYFKGTDNATFVVGNIFNALGRAGTPMFMMLTGALLLDEKKKSQRAPSIGKTCYPSVCCCCSGCSFMLSGVPCFRAIPLICSSSGIICSS